jgi:hypothetical protein
MRAIVLASVLLIGGMLAACGMSKTQADRILTEQARVAAEAVMFSLKASLWDPRGAQWGAVWANGGRICGTFNPKDSSGAFTGFRRFVGQKGGRVLIEEWSDREFDLAWSDYCTHAHLLVQAGEPAGPAIHPMTDEERAAEQAAFGARPVKLPERKGEAA